MHAALALEFNEHLSRLAAPREVLAAHSLGEILMCAGLDESEVQASGLSDGAVIELINASPELSLISSDRALTMWRSSAEGGLAWLEVMREIVVPIDEHWRVAMGISWALRSQFTQGLVPDSGEVGLRVNGLLYASRLDFSCADVQHAYFGLAKDIAEGKTSGMEDLAFVAGSAVTGAVVGYLSMGAGVGVLGKAVGWASERLHAIDEWTLDHAYSFMLASAFLDTQPERAQMMADHYYRTAMEISRNDPSGGQARRVRMLLHAYKTLSAPTDDRPASVWVPDLVGMRLGDAVNALKAVGINTVSFVDAVAPEQEHRTPLSRNKWVVRGQSPAPSTKASPGIEVTLAFSRANERALPHLVDLRLNQP